MIHSFGQFTLNLGKNIYHKALIELEDGTEKSGFVLSFDDRNVVYLSEVKHYQNLFGSPEFTNGLTKEFYDFRKDEASKDEKIPLNSIKKITVEEKNSISNQVETEVYEKVNIIKPTNDLTMEVRETPVLLPVYFSNSKLTIYNFTEILCSGNSITKCNIKGYNYYFKPKNSEVAVKPFEITIGSVFNLKKLGPKMYLGLEYMGKDCPAYLGKLASNKEKYQEDFASVANKEYSQSFKEAVDKVNADLKAAKKSMSKEDYKQYEIEVKLKQFKEQDEMFYEALFNEEVMNFINSCE